MEVSGRRAARVDGVDETSLASDVVVDNLTDTCTKHADRILEYYCKTHNKVVCMVCATVSHRSCEDVQYIPDIAAGTADSRKCKDLPPELKALTGKLTNIEFQAGESIEALKKTGDSYSQRVQTYRDQLVAIIDKLAADAEDKKKTYVEKQIAELNSICTVSQERRHNIEAVTAHINDRRRAAQEKMLFVSLQQAENLAADCQNHIASVENNESVYASRIEFKNNTNLLDMLSNVGSLGDAVTGIQSNVGSLGDAVTSIQSNVGSLGDAVTSIQRTGDINVQAASEGQCRITDLHILSDGRLIVADYINNSVKLFDSSHRLKSRVQLQSRPYDIAEVSSGEVAVLLPNSDTIQFLSISGDINPGRTMKTGCRSRSMAISGDIIIQLTDKTYTSGCCIVKLDLNGRTLQTTDIGSGIDMNDIWCIRIHPADNNIYASHDGGVTCVTQQGKVVAEYKDAELQRPRGLAIHPDGSVYVCGEGSNNIHHITAECKKIDVILGHGEIKWPLSICFDREGKLLYVSDDSNNELKVFRLFM